MTVQHVDKDPDPTAWWIVEQTASLVSETLELLSGGEQVAGAWPLESVGLFYPALGPGVALAWSAYLDDNPQAKRQLALATAERYLADAPTLRVPRFVFRASSRLPASIRPSWQAGAAISGGALLGWFIFGMEEHMSAHQRGRLIKALVRCHDEVAKATRLTFYINGNYQLPMCELAYFKWVLTGSEAASEAYEQQVQFLCRPDLSDSRWVGYGLHLIEPPVRHDWHDAKGYFTEVPIHVMAPEQTFDGEYTQLQLDYAIRAWFLTGDARMLSFANALLNAVLPQVDMTTWLCDFRHGSRRNQIVPFYNGAPATLYLHDPRPELLTSELVRDQFITAIDAEFRRASASGIDNYRLRAYGITLLSLLLAGSPALRKKLREHGGGQHAERNMLSDWWPGGGSRGGRLDDSNPQAPAELFRSK